MLDTLTEPFRRLSRRFQDKRTSKNYAAKIRASLKSNYEQHLKRCKTSSVEVRFEGTPEQQLIKELSCDSCHFNVDDKLQIRQVSTRKIVAEGLVVARDAQIRIKLLKPLFFRQFDLEGENNKFLIEPSTRDIRAKRASNERAIRRFEQAKCSTVLHDLILGNYKDARNVRYSRSRLAPLEELPALKGNQLVAAKNSISRRISLVEGVAGSGKSVVAAHIIHSLCRFKKAKVLFCSPVESSVNGMAQMIVEMELLRVVKLGCKQPDRGAADLDYLIEQAMYDRTMKSLLRLETENELTPAALDRLRKRSSNVAKNCSRWSRSKLQKRILKKANVVCCTISELATNIISDLEFDVLILDDTHLASEVDCFAPLMTKGLKQVILMSEMRHHIRFARLSSINNMITMDSSGEDQLLSLKRKYSQNYKYSQRKHAKSNKLSSDIGGLFERLLYMGLTTVALNRQYRMQDYLCAFPRSQFYLSIMKTDNCLNRELNERARKDIATAEGGLDWLPNKEQMTALFPVENSTSHLDELGIVLSKLVDLGKIEGNRIGVISDRKLEAVENLSCELGTIEDFVGREKDYIILYSSPDSAREEGVVKQDGRFDVNFKKSDNALNIALTRAKLGLFIIANLNPNERCCKSWQEMLGHYSKHELVVREEVTYHLIDVEQKEEEAESNSQ